MTRADKLNARADDLDLEADTVRWTEPRTAKHLTAIARDLRDIAAHLPPERTTP